MAEPRTVSELEQIKNNEIDGNDLLLVSDYDNKYTSKKMTIKQLVQYIAKEVAKSSPVQQQITQQANTIAQNVVSEQTMVIVQQNIDDIHDMLDNVLDNQYLIDGGDSGAEAIEKLEELKANPFKTAIKITVEVMKKTDSKMSFMKIR